MKKSSVLFTMASVLLSATLILSGCDKKNDDPVDVNTEDLQQLSDDEKHVYKLMLKKARLAGEVDVRLES